MIKVIENHKKPHQFVFSKKILFCLYVFPHAEKTFHRATQKYSFCKDNRCTLMYIKPVFLTVSTV